ncbi:MAG: hypothetical protein JSV44_04800, partial [Candidatus Zixiibacteriota bacterium]
EESNFSSASGAAMVELAEGPEDNLNVGSASGKALLDYNGNPVTGYFELTAKVRSGSISAPFDFDDEREFRKNGQRYVKKTFTRGSDSPEIMVGTASGRAILKK